MKYKLFVFSVLIWALASASAQELRVRPLDLDGRQNPYHVKWDSVFNRLVAYRDGEVDTLDMAAARIFDQHGKNVGAYPLKNLEGVYWANIWDAAATPDGGIVLAAVVGYGKHVSLGEQPRPPMKNMLITFAPDGKFVNAFETGPKSHTHKLVVDEKGNIYSLGDADREGAYPLLVKYSPEGKVLGEFMPSSLFATGDDVIDSSQGDGDMRMWIKKSHVFVWLPLVKELLQYSRDGELLSRTSLSETLQKKAAELGYVSTEVRAIDTTSNGDVIMQCRFWSADMWNVKVLVLRMTSNGQDPQQLGPDLDDFAAGELMAVSPKDGLIFSKYDPDGGMVLSETSMTSGSFAKK